MKHFLSTLLSALIWVFILVLSFFVCSGLYQHFFQKDRYNGFFGIGYAVVVSGSMEPNIHVNDLVIYQAHDAEEYQVGDVIVYTKEEDGGIILITHRITKVTADKVTTKGDANNVSDLPIYKDAIVGRIVWRIPEVGVIVDFIKTPIGYASIACAIILLIIINIVLSRKPLEKKPVEV